MIKRILQHFIKNGGLPWLLVGILLATLWTGADIAGASSALKRLLAPSDPPTMVNYQGLVNLSGVPYDGTGYFKFAVVDSASGDGSTNHWANDGAASGEPTASITRTVSSGLFNVLLGDTSITGMTQSITHTAFAETDTYLRVWFSQDGVSFDALAPNQRLASVPYALRAQYAENSLGSLNCNAEYQIAQWNGSAWVVTVHPPLELEKGILDITGKNGYIKINKWQLKHQRNEIKRSRPQTNRQRLSKRVSSGKTTGSE